MSRIKRITLPEFLWLIEYAQKHHSTLNEPIPQIYQNQHDAIRSCLDSPFMSFGGSFLYKGFDQKAAFLFYLLNKNHPLANGNKRMACLCLGYFCAKNRHDLNISWQSFYEIAIEVVKSDPAEKDIIVEVLATTIRKYTKKAKSSKP